MEVIFAAPVYKTDIIRKNVFWIELTVFFFIVAASGEDHQCSTPKFRKNDITSGGHYSHPATPQSTVPSPGAASMNSTHEEYDMSSPSWPRTPASPVSVTESPHRNL